MVAPEYLTKWHNIELETGYLDLADKTIQNNENASGRKNKLVKFPGPLEVQIYSFSYSSSKKRKLVYTLVLKNLILYHTLSII